MITPDAAETLARQVKQDYVSKCHCDTPDDVGNALMKLASMCGVGMCATVGHADAVARMQGTTDYIAKAMTTERPPSKRREEMAEHYAAGATEKAPPKWRGLEHVGGDADQRVLSARRRGRLYNAARIVTAMR